MVGCPILEAGFAVFEMEIGLPVEGGAHRLEGFLGGGGFVFRGVEPGGTLPAEGAFGGDVRGVAERNPRGQENGRRGTVYKGIRNSDNNFSNG